MALTLATTDIIQMVSDLGDAEGLKINLKESFKGGIITGVTTAATGFLLGPIGLVIGGVLGGVTSYCLSSNAYQPIGTVLNNMSPEKKELLAIRIRGQLGAHSIKDISQFSRIFTSPMLRSIMINMAVGILMSLGAYIVDKLGRKMSSKERPEESKLVGVEI